MKYILLVFSVFLLSCGNTIYVVRHAEKETGIDPTTMKTFTDPPLSFEGQQRALKLKEVLSSKDIKYIYSTNTLRTLSTAKPLKELYLDVPINIYSSKPDSTDAFIQKLRSIKKGNVLVVGHSNTIDDIANKLTGSKVVAGDLKDSDYDNLYEIKRKGDKYVFKHLTYGKATE
ncbi:MAG TPA: histidine phosphatase family protein [Chitinophagaceae bacterium]|nr:histidine phosphatase family protein [Chitinophagaceae bacterium]